jgi:hypothetical protein
MQPPRSRLPDWPARLADYIEARSAMPWAWGAHDCCHFSARAFEALTGADVLGPILEGRVYTTALAAARTLQALGGLPALPARAGLRQLPAVAQAARGDIVLAPIGRRGALALGVVADHRAAFAHHPGGLLFFPISRSVGAWRT